MLDAVNTEAVACYVGHRRQRVLDVERIQPALHCRQSRFAHAIEDSMSRSSGHAN